MNKLIRILKKHITNKKFKINQRYFINLKMEKVEQLANREEKNWGDLPLIQSDTNLNLKYTKLSELEALEDGTPVILRCRIQSSRQKGNLCFLVLRQNFYTVQAIAFKSNETPKPMIKFMGKVPNESVIDIYAKIKKLKKPVKSCSIQNIELGVDAFYVLSRAKNVLPFQMEDAMRRENRTEEEENAKDAKIVVNLKTRLDNRILDLRTPANQAIFRIQSGVCRYYREYLTEQNFIEIHTPKLLGGSSEGGSEVFELKYFGKKACLAQSPQLFKQMMIMADFERVFEIGPVFRAENSNTHRHLCEFVGLDGEMEIKEHYSEVMDLIGGLFKNIFTGLQKNFSKEIKIVNEQYELEDFIFAEETVILTFEEGVNLLKEAGIEQDLHDDLSTVNERSLGKLVREKYKTDFYILHRYPEEARPFYTMLCKDDPRFTCSYDVFMRGQEIISGAQRIHEAEMLKVRAVAKEMKVETIQEYVDSFCLGALPHGGFGVGLERVVMLFLGLYDIRKASAFPRDPQRLSP